MKKLLIISILCFYSIQAMELSTSDTTAEKNNENQLYYAISRKMITADDTERERKLSDSVDMKKIDQIIDSLLKDNSCVQHDYSVHLPLELPLSLLWDPEVIKEIKTTK